MTGPKHDQPVGFLPSRAGERSVRRLRGMIDDALCLGQSSLRSDPTLQGSIAPLLNRLRQIDALLARQPPEADEPISRELQRLFREPPVSRGG